MQHPPRILLVASAPIREPLSRTLSASGFDVSAMEAGPASLMEAKGQVVDLLLLDLDAIGPDSSAALCLLKEGEAAGDDFLPVVGLGAADRQQRLRALRAGADEGISDPWDVEVLLARVEALLRIKAVQDRVRQRKRELERLSITDALTGLCNRRLFEERLREEFARAQRYGDPLALLMVDLDHFKEVNDQYGHVAGDEVLRGVASVLRRCVRETDIVTRFGGEEFAVILPQTHLAGGLVVADRVWREIGSSTYAAPAALKLSASLGSAGYPGRALRASIDLVSAADEALYRAKRHGRNCICQHPSSPSPTVFSRDQGRGEASLRWARGM